MGKQERRAYLEAIRARYLQYPPVLSMGRRSPTAEVSVEMQAKYLRVAENSLAGWQTSQRLMIEHGHIHALDAGGERR